MKIILLLCSLLLVFSSAVAAQEVSVYPVEDVFISPTASEAFKKALSNDGSGKDHLFGINTFLEEFKANFPGAAATIDNGNKYGTFAAYVRVPRVSLYEIQKTQQLVDMYLPVTMSVTFANMVTGESLYSYAYTYYSVFGTTSDAKAAAEGKITEFYRETYRDLMKKVIGQAKQNFAPFSIAATVKRVWNDNYILDKGMDSGVVKGDVLTDQRKNQLSVVYSSRKYCVAQKLLGDPQKESVFTKFSNQAIDELKKSKVMLLGNKNGETFIKSNAVPDNVVYQLFVDALGKKAPFSLVSVDRSFYEIQREVTELTQLTQEVTQNREMPDYFLRLYFYGPFYTKSPTNKPYVSVDNYTIMVCGDVLDSNGRVVHGTCVDDKITDEVFGTIRYPNEAREEILVKNAIIKLADEFARNVKFQTLQLPVVKTEGDNVVIEDKQNALVPGQGVVIFKKLDRTTGIDDDVYVPVWQVAVGMKNGGVAVASKTLPLSSKPPDPSMGDMIYVDAAVASGADNMKALKMCGNGATVDGDYVPAGMEKLFAFLLPQQTKYPFYDGKDFSEGIGQYNDPGFGFKRKMQSSEIRSDYCVEPVVKITRQGETPNKDFTTYKFSLLQGTKIYKGKDVIWKKGLQQDVTVSAPAGYEGAVLDFEFLHRVSTLMVGDIVKKIELP